MALGDPKNFINRISRDYMAILCQLLVNNVQYRGGGNIEGQGNIKHTIYADHLL